MQTWIEANLMTRRSRSMNCRLYLGHLKSACPRPSSQLLKFMSLVTVAAS